MSKVHYNRSNLVGRDFPMQLLIMSDTHGDEAIIGRVRGFYPDADIMIHCGDSELNVNHPHLTPFYKVKGNCDYGQPFPEEVIIEAGALKVYVTHGHLYNVKSTLMPLSYRALEVGANIVCFGHSHILGAEQVGDTLFLNPGSLKAPRGRKEKTFMLAVISDRNVRLKCLDENNNLLSEHPFVL